MGQSTSKGLSKAAEKIGKKALEHHKPPLPSRCPPPAAATSSETTSAPAPPLQPPPTSGANPGNFLRGDGIAKEDVRDLGQEMYWQHIQKRTEQQQQHLGISHEVKSLDTSTNQKQQENNMPTAASMEMPDDLLKFIQDVGPARQTIDRELTTPRLLQKENAEELQKLESSRKPVRQRRKMPLMGQDDRFTTEKNTHFRQGEDDTRTARGVVIKDFGLENLHLYDLLVQRESNVSKSNEDIAKAFSEKITEKAKDQAWTDEEKEQQQRWFQQAMKYIEIPTIRLDSDGNMLGLYSKDVPGPEVKSVSTIPESKVMLVLKDLSQTTGSQDGGGSAAGRLAERRKERKLQSVS
ncbi:hypothetical protein IV203_012427 [Nitzschia inconspicua]|uniref:Uncharacterized protein n=1 Tax=Nitzschia inconspicua TaxID=303405 RepID=A0A9K3KV80_9STRA|nr:hypothetical protein IV203_012427 [Nitzschia inconspicua]